MSQPLPHAIMRWQLRRSLLESERHATQELLADARTSEEREALADKLRDIERSLRAMGPDPSPKMG